MTIIKKSIVKISIIVLIVCMIIVGGLKMYSYIKVARLCDDIKAGKEIDTKIGNASTAPLIFDEIAAILQIGGPRIPLVEACYHGNIKAVQVLLDNGASPNFFIKGRWTPLEGAVFGYLDETRFEIIKLLVENGADVNLHSGDGLHSVVFRVAARLNKETDDKVLQEIILYLIDNGANKKDSENGSTVLHYAVYEDKVLLAKTLIEEHGFEINVRGNNSRTPLISAAISGSIECVKYLLDAGADKTLVDNDGKTAYEYAIENGYTEIAELIGE